MERRSRPPERREDAESPPRRSPDAAQKRTQQLVLPLLFSIAQSDKTIGPAEQAILERYRRALEVRAAVEPLALEEGVGAIDLQAIPLGERAHVLRMMFRVAFADGVCNEIELALLRRLAGMMGLSKVQFADIQVSVERQVRDRQRGRRRFVILLVAVVIVAAALVVISIRQLGSSSNAETEALRADTEEELFTLRELIEQAGSVDRAEQDLGRVRESSERVERDEGQLLARVEVLERDRSQPAPDTSSRLAGELEALKQQVAELQERQSVFKTLERRYAESVLLILVRFDMVAGPDDRRRSMGYGTGFFVTPGGLIVTSKHVVQPWKFVGDPVKLADNGYVLDQASVRVAAWTAGSEVLNSSGNTVLDNAFDTGRDTLRVVALPADEMQQRLELLSDGTLYEGRFHAQNNSDLALLQASVTQPVTPLPLAHDSGGVEKLDPVMVLGFPTGLAILEHGKAETSPSLGQVRKVEDSLFVTAPIVPGNSGGPVIDQTGRVVGIAARTAQGEATLGACIPSRHVLPLLPPASELMAEAARMIDQGHDEHGRVLLDLAAARQPSAEEGTRIGELRRRLVD